MIGPEQLYRKPSKPSPPERRGVSTRSVIEEAKSRVPIIDFADLLCGPGKMRRAGERWVVRCPIPDHTDKTPSFCIWPAEGRCWCFGCSRGGDVVDLASLAWGIDNPAAAAAEVLLTFGHELPQRPPSWFRRQKRQQPMRDGIEEVKIYAARRRLYRRFFEPLVLATEDEEDRKHDAELFWEATADLAEHLFSNMIRAR